MSNHIQTYIELRIKKILESGNPEDRLSFIANTHPGFRKLWTSEKNNKNIFWQKINSNEDVIKLIEEFDGSVRFVEKNVPFGCGHIEDDYRMTLAEYRLIQGLRKMANCIDPAPYLNLQTEFTAMSEEEINELFNRIEKIIVRMKEQNLRRAMQD